MENERRIDRTTSMGMDEHRLSDILHASQIKATDIYETPPQIIWIDNSTIATLGNFSASTGKAKSKKTFNVSALVAASLAGKQVLNYRAHLPEGKQRILYVDTEQSRFHCRSVLERILRLAGLPTTTDPENLDFSACVNIRRQCVSRSSTMRCANRKATDWSSSTAFAT